MQSLVVANINKRLLCRRMIDIGVERQDFMKIMAFWMWLDAQGFKELVPKLTSNTDKFLAFVVDEAKAVLATLDPNSAAPILPNLCPITSIILSDTFSLYDLFRNKENISRGVADLHDGVCRVLFKDVLEEGGAKVGVGGGEEEGDEFGNTKVMIKTVPGGAGLLGSCPEDKMAAVTVGTQLNAFAKEWDPAVARAPEAERTLFLTFSNGFPLDEDQIIKFFNQWVIENVSRKYGACVERVYVHRPDPNAPPIFGKVVFNTCFIPATVMGKLEQAKFIVDSKPLWCKRFDPKKKRLES